MKKLLPVILVIAMNVCGATVPQYLPQELKYNPSIPTPSEFLGYKIGERHLTHSELVAYLEQLSNKSTRIDFLEIGRTHGHRPLVHLRISSPKNLERMKSIQQAHQALTNPSQSKDIDLEKLPLVMNLNYSVHGNEASGCNAAAVVAYYLAATDNESIREILANTVIVLDPVLNPDGMDRFANWTNRYSGRNPNMDPNSLEHAEGWPNGRTNYYWFDLNRDWLLLTQPESRARLRQYNQWMPDLVLDFHEMESNSTYFFQPGVPERNHPLTPQANFDLTKKISRYFADALDSTGSLYYSEERFDDFYMGKGSTMPDLKGSVGILFEQASSRGMVRDSVNGPVSFPFAIQNQVTISMACLKVARELRIELLDYKRNFFRESMEAAKSSGIAGYRFASPGDPARAREFVNVLAGHGIQVEMYVEEDAWYVPARQPHYRFLESMVEQRSEFKENIFYDITAWTLPLAYNLEWKALKSAPETGARAAVVPNLDRGSLGYLVDWAGMNAPRLLFDLLQEDIIVKVAKKSFTLNKEKFGYGTLFVPLTLQKDKTDRIHQILEESVQSKFVSVVPVDTYLTEKGIDLGSPDFVRIDSPNLLLATGRGLNAYDTGTVWHLLDVLHDYPLTLVDVMNLGHIDLSNYTAVILMNASAYAFTPSAADNLKEWVSEGGTLICTGRSNKWAMDKELVGLSMVKSKDDPEKQETNERPRRAFDQASDDRALERIQGAIFLATVDISHPLAYGYSDTQLPVFFSGESFLNPSKNRYQTPLVFEEDPLLAGYASTANLEKLAGSAAAVVESRGAGEIILFGLQPTFRAYWRGTEKLLINAMLYGSLMHVSDPGAYSE